MIEGLDNYKLASQYTGYEKETAETRLCTYCDTDHEIENMTKFRKEHVCYPCYDVLVEWKKEYARSYTGTFLAICRNLKRANSLDFSNVNLNLERGTNGGGN